MDDLENLDKIIIRELALSSEIGWEDRERAFPQRIVLDIEVYTHTAKAGRSGELKDTICYLTLREEIQTFVKNRSFRLAEELAEKLVSDIFERHPAAQGVRMQVRKFLLLDASWGGVEIIRRRS